jgi:hypothetical protein
MRRQTMTKTTKRRLMLMESQSMEARIMGAGIWVAYPAL